MNYDLIVISGSDSNLANDKDKIGYLSSGISADGLSNTVIEHGGQNSDKAADYNTKCC